jgi:hypothetical protein
MAGAITDAAAGNTIYVSDNHDETTAAAITLTFPGDNASPNRVLCVDDSAEPPTALATTGIIKTTTGANSRNIIVQGSAYVEGLTFAPAYGAATNYANIQLNTAAPDIQKYVKCAFVSNGINNSNKYLRLSSGTGNSFVHLDDCTIDMGGGTSSPGVTLYNRVDITGGSYLNPPSVLFTPKTDAGRTFVCTISGMDLSAAGSGCSLVNVTTLGAGIIGFINCKLGASVALTTGTWPGYGGRVRVHNSDSADTQGFMYEEDYAGYVTRETTIKMTGGASDGTTGYSWKMVSSAGAEYPMIPFVSPVMVTWNDTTGSSITVTAEIVHDSQGAGTGSDFQDDEIWLEVLYLGTSGFPLGGYITNAKATVLSTAADHPNSSETWTTTGLTTPVKQSLSVSFTPQEKGYVHATVRLAKASKTVYVNPPIIV